jgi:glycosyltransferase involved in cell wall biosynthesis
MRICYVLLSPTFGMHQYTADLANRMAAAGHDVSLVTTTHLPRDRYAPEVRIETPAALRSTGLGSESLNPRALNQVAAAILALRPEVVHFTGPHLWNTRVMSRLKKSGIPLVHTIHDLDAHEGMRLGRLLTLWNRAVLRSADKVLVHGRQYRRRLIAGGMAAERVIYAPLLHLFLSHEQEAVLGEECPVVYEPFILFFGRLEKYKGVEHLLTAFAEIERDQPASFRLVLAGSGRLEHVWAGGLPPGVDLQQGLIGDAEALELFRRCSLVVLPYIDATQSALVGAAYFFRKPALVSRSGALAEYVVEGETGFIVEPAHPASLARSLTEALGDPARLQEMGQNGREWYEQQRRLEWKALEKLYGL